MEDMDAHTEKVEAFHAVCEELCDLHSRKNADYGDSFMETFQKLGLVSAAVRISDKTNRLCALTKYERHVKDETVEDTLQDLACYAIMALIALRKEKGC